MLQGGKGPGGRTMTETAGTEAVEGQQLTQRQRIADIVWKVAATLLVAFLIYVMLHLASQLIELQGG